MGRKQTAKTPIRNILRLQSQPELPPEMEIVLGLWEGLDGAINDILTAQPSRLSQAAERLASQRQHMRDGIQKTLLSTMRLAQNTTP